ncbi:MAG TPA: hypothetical protein VN699_08115 [Pirellulales bacterium]|nr:hypothetical protein [Pirellulales bacterium]
MNNRWRWFGVRACGLVCGVVAIAALAAAASQAAEEEADFKIHEISLWGFDPTLDQANQLQHYPSVMPGMVDTDRSRAGAEGKVAPFSLMTFHGQGVKNLEIDLRVQSGRFVAHWPAGESKSGRLRWIDVNTSAEADKEGRVATVDAKHWFTAARQLDALYVQLGARMERFIIYDAEFKLDQPLQISGGADHYQVTNYSKTPLADVLIVAPEAGGRRIGRLALLPAKAVSAQKPTESKPTESKPDEKKPAETKPEGAPPEAKQPEEKKPVKETPKAEPSEEKKTEEKPAETKPAAAPQAAAPAAAANAGAPAAATPSTPNPPPAVKETAAAKQAAIEARAGPSVDVEMSAPLADGAAELSEARQSLADSLTQQGLTKAEVELFMERAAPAIFGAKEMIVVCRLPGDAVEERLPLVTYPAAIKTVRTAVLVLRNIDPKIKDDVQRLIANLGAADYAERETAEKRLGELGRLAVPALKEALKSSDAEVQFRAERLLLAQNEKVDGT